MKKTFYPLIFLWLIVVNISNAQKIFVDQKNIKFNGRNIFLLSHAGQSSSSNLLRSNNARTSSCSSDSIVLTRQSQVDSFPITNPGCTTLRYLKIDGTNANPAITRLDSLRYITQINEWFEVSNTSVQNFSVLTGLTTVGSNLGIGILWISHNDSLRTLSFPTTTNLNNVGFMVLDNLPNLSNISGFIHNLFGGSSPTGVGMAINNTGLVNLTGLDSLHYISSLYITGNHHLHSLQGVQHVTAIDYHISLFGNDSLTDISALSQITNLSGGTLECSYNGMLTNLNGFSNITNIDGALWILGSIFTNLSGLNPSLVIHNNNNDSLRIQDNAQLSVCNSPPICNFLSTSSAAIIINNAPGCEDIVEVQASCAQCDSVHLKTWTAASDDNWNNPANWSPTGVPSSCDSVVIHAGPTRPALNANATIHALTMESGSELYFNGYGLTVNGDLSMDGVTGGGCNFLTVNYAKNILINNSSFFIKALTINNYLGSLTITNNVFNPAFGQCDVSINDAPSRENDASFEGNFINGNLVITTNSHVAPTFISANSADNVTGNVTFNTLSNSLNFEIGDNGTGNALFIGHNLIVNNFSNLFHLNRIEFTGGNDVHITQLGTIPVNIFNLRINKNPGSKIILDQDVYINNNAHFNIGLVKSAPGKLLIFKYSAGIDQFSSSSWVWGPVKKIGSGYFRFPVGDSLHQAVVDMESQQASLDSMTAQYFGVNPTSAGYDISQHASSLTRVSNKEYWTLTHVAGPVTGRTETGGPPPPPTITLSYDSTRSGSLQSIYSLRVSHWKNNSWQNQGASTVTGNTSQSYVTASDTLSSFNVVTLGYVEPPRIPIITIGQADTLACVGHLIHIPFSLDTLAYSNNQFKAELSDSSGSFSNLTYLGYIISNHSDTLPVYLPPNIAASNYYRLRVVGTIPPDTSVNQPVIKIQRPAASSLTITGSSLGCIGGGVYKYYVTPLEQGVHYNWSLNGGGTMTTNNDTAYVTWTTAGSYTLSVTNSNICGNGGTANKSITVSGPAPGDTPILSHTGRWLNSSLAAANQNATSFRWFRNDTIINGANASSYYASLGGSYKVSYSNLCGAGPASNIISFSANSIPQTINFSTIPDKIYTDSPFVLPALASSGLPVSFTIISGPGNIPANIYHITGTGAVTIRATQVGDDVYDTAAPAQQSFTVNKAPQTITFPAISDKEYNTPPFALNAFSNSGLPITYSLVSGPATITNGTVTLTGAGTVTIRTTQAGDTNYLAASPVDRSFCSKISQLNPISGPTIICPGVNATYTVNNISGATYTWRIAGGSTLASTTNTVTTQWPSPGSYILIVSATGNCSSPSANDSLTITAITSVQPDSVHNMLPADGATNQQLPLTLSWIPANPNLFYTYDVYLWRSDSSQPSTPYVSNLTTVNYTIPLNSGLSYNHTYKWMVVAHNGSCTVINTGPVQQFSLIPLPDLQVYNVTAPSSAFSGQSVSVTWKVKNNGPGNTQLNQHWTDAVYISTDSILRFSPFNLKFPADPKLVASKQNISALNSGEFYSDTATFTLPIDYSGPLYMHVITNYAPPADNPVLETTKVNDTAHALPATVVTLSPQPDLRVDTIVNPGNTFSGSTINVTYKVKNYGVNANGSWIDKIYISKDPLFNINNATLLKFPNGDGTYYPASDALLQKTGPLQQDSSYTISTQIVVPNFIYGSYYVYVFTNSTNSLYEGPNNNNDVNHGNPMQVFLTATPKLVPDIQGPPANVSITQSVTLFWRDKNLGAYDNMEKNQGHYYVINGNCTYYTDPNSPILNVYGHTYRDSLGFGSSQWTDRVYLSNDSSGLNITTATLLAETPFHDPSYYSPLGSTCLNYQPANQRTANAILPGSYAPQNGINVYQYTIPDNLPQGDYYLYDYANVTKSVYEYPGTPQITRTNKFTVVWPDLTVPSVTVPASGNSGQPVTINYTLLNNGPGAVYNHFRKDYVYLGNNSTFDGTAVKIDSFVYSSASVPVNISQSLQKAVTLPNGISGTKYIFIRANADSSFKETNLNNNIHTTGTPINISLTPPPDLVVSSVSLPDTVYSSSLIPFKYTVTNNGSGVASGTWKDSIYISCNSSFSYNTSYFVGVRTEQRFVAVSSNYTDSFALVVPLTYLLSTTGCMNNDTTHLYFFVRSNANNGVYEQVTNNNLLASVQKTFINSEVDHIVTSVSSSDSAIVGRYFQVKWTVKNIGLNPNDYSYNQWNDAFYLSPDSVLNSNARRINNKVINLRLNHNQTYTDSLFGLIPNLPAGYYYLLEKTNYSNEILAERNIANNVNLRRDNSGQPLKVYVTNPPAPDLTDTILSAPSSVAVGQPLKIVYRIKNIGVGPTYPISWTDDIWLSNSLQPGGLLLAQKFHTGVLNPGQSYTDSIFTNISINQPQGNYVIVIKTNHDNIIYESNYVNDVYDQYISVYVPAPTDLVVNNITSADTVILGKKATVGWRLSNISNNPANGVETDGIYLSKDSTTNTTNDVLIGTQPRTLNILPLNFKDTTLQPVVSGVTEGNYFVKIKTDILNNILETNKNNNTGVINHKVYVKVKVLPLNVITPDTLTSNYLYYKLVIPSSLNGKTISVKLTSNDSLTANNQMYIGLGYLPSAAHFDYTFDRPGFGNQQIIIESVVDSVYYIAAKSSMPNNTNQNITLYATQLPFTILNVNSNHGGNTGNVTIQIKGTLFRDSMTATLHNGSTNITAFAMYFVNSTTVYATFNLHGAALGVYDVILTKPDASTATLPSGFTIEQGNNGGLLTGSGANSGQTGSGNSPGCDPGATSGLNSQLQTEIVYPPKVFVGWPFIIEIHYSNPTNTDIPAQIKILYSIDGAPIAFSEAGLTEGKTSLVIEFKDLVGPPNTIRAGGSGTIKIYCKAPANAFAHELIHFNLQ